MRSTWCQEIHNNIYKMLFDLKHNDITILCNIQLKIDKEMRISRRGNN